MKYLKVLAVSAVAAISVNSAFAGKFYDNGRDVWRIKAHVATGVNDFCGEPVWDFPIRFTFLGEYDPSPGAEDAFPLTSENCQNSDLVLATTTDPNFQAASGAPQDASLKNKNLPLKDVAVTVAGDGSRAFPPLLSETPYGPSVVKGGSADPITMGDWLEAGGRAKLVCHADGTAKFSARFFNLVPNGVYTMWAIWGTVLPDGGTGMAAVPLGGVPNVVAADRHGYGAYSRQLAGCPMTDFAEDGSQMSFIDLVYHSDGAVTAGMPVLGGNVVEFVGEDGEVYSSTLAAGTVAHTHLIFPLAVEKL